MTDTIPTADAVLLPCPFCGAPAERVDIDEGDSAGGSCIACTRCLASSNVEFEFKENFVSNWNTRAALATPAPQPDALDARTVEAAAIALWHRFAPGHRENWKDETHKEEYRHAAAAVLALAAPPQHKDAAAVDALTREQREKLARKAFERANRENTDLERVENGWGRPYKHSHVEVCWQGWRDAWLFRDKIAAPAAQGDAERTRPCPTCGVL